MDTKKKKKKPLSPPPHRYTPHAHFFGTRSKTIGISRVPVVHTPIKIPPTPSIIPRKRFVKLFKLVYLNNKKFEIQHKKKKNKQPTKI